MVGTEVSVFLFSLLAAIMWAFGGVIAKRGFSFGGSPILIAVLGSFLGTVIFWAILLISTGPSVFTHLSTDAIAVFFLSGVLGTGTGRVFLYVGIDRVGATIGEAISATHPLVATVLALVFIGEPIRYVEFLGMTIVVAGLVVLSISKGGDISGWKRWELLIPLGGALGFGAGNMLRRYGFVITEATPIEGTAINSTAAFVGVLGFILASRNTSIFRTSRNAYAYFFFGGLLLPLGLLSLMTALNIGRVVLVVPIAGTAPLFTVFFSYIFLGDLERITTGILVGVGLIVFGIALLTGF